MKRSIRRHQQQMAKTRRLRILYGHAYGHSWRSFERSWTIGSYTHVWAEKPWRSAAAKLMSEPGWWRRLYMLRPMRIDSNRQLRLIEKGFDPDQFQWRDGKKPHIYYW